MKHSLYFNEEQVVEQAEYLTEALEQDFCSRSGEEVLENLHGLVTSYRKSFREQQRLLRVSDRDRKSVV